MLGLLALLLATTKGQVRTVAEGVVSNGPVLVEVRDTLRGHTGMLVDIAGTTGEANGKLDHLRSDLNTRLDRQVAVMDRTLEQEEEQTALLAEIRDRMAPTG